MKTRPAVVRREVYEAVRRWRWRASRGGISADADRSSCFRSRNGARLASIELQRHIAGLERFAASRLQVKFRPIGNGLKPDCTKPDWRSTRIATSALQLYARKGALRGRPQSTSSRLQMSWKLHRWATPYIGCGGVPRWRLLGLQVHHLHYKNWPKNPMTSSERRHSRRESSPPSTLSYLRRDQEATFVWHVRPSGGTYKGIIYTDGSRLDGRDPRLGRNGWAFVVKKRHWTHPRVSIGCSTTMGGRHSRPQKPGQ